jgi:hypothetical protein
MSILFFINLVKLKIVLTGTISIVAFFVDGGSTNYELVTPSVFYYMYKFCPKSNLFTINFKRKYRFIS